MNRFINTLFSLLLVYINPAPIKGLCMVAFIVGVLEVGESLRFGQFLILGFVADKGILVCITF